MSWSTDGHKLDVALHGSVAFTDDLTDVQTLSDGGSLTLRSWIFLVRTPSRSPPPTAR